MNLAPVLVRANLWTQHHDFTFSVQYTGEVQPASVMARLVHGARMIASGGWSSRSVRLQFQHIDLSRACGLYALIYVLF
jgi:hypothetical protein